MFALNAHPRIYFCPATLYQSELYRSVTSFVPLSRQWAGGWGRTRKCRGIGQSTVIGFGKRTVTRKRVTDTFISVAASACVNEHRRPPTSARHLPEKWKARISGATTTFMPFFWSYAFSNDSSNGHLSWVNFSSHITKDKKQWFYNLLRWLVTLYYTALLMRWRKKLHLREYRLRGNNYCVISQLKSISVTSNSTKRKCSNLYIVSAQVSFRNSVLCIIKNK